MNDLFRSCLREGPNAFSFEVAGIVSDNAVRQLEQSPVNGDQSSIVNLILWLLGLTLLFAGIPARAAELKPETVRTWGEYVKGVTARTQEHLIPGNSFLSIDDSPAQTAKLRRGEILVDPAGPRIPLKIPFGLIHDWVGEAFIPGVTIPEVLRVVRDYGDYKSVYRPNVVESKRISTSEWEDRFSLLIVNKSLIAGSALDSDYRTCFTRLDDEHWYGTAETTRVQEVAEYGSPSQHLLPENKGAGIIWRLNSITRFEERDGGVYIELEAMALSRDVPSSLRWLIDPIIRRVSRSALETSLRQTEDAVRARTTDINASLTRSPCPTGKDCAAASTGPGAGRSFQ